MQYYKRFFNVILVCCLTFGTNSYAQKALILKGRVVEKENGDPISFCAVALAGTSIGSTTDKDGFFEIKDLPHEPINIIISHIAFENKVLSYAPNKIPEFLTIELSPAVVELGAVVVNTKGKGKTARRRRREMQGFMKMVLGAGYDDRLIELVNEEVLDMPDLTAHRSVYSKKYDLKFENRFLGYSIDYFNFSFYINELSQSFFGYPVYKNLEPENDEQKQQWEKNREKVYNGSLRHFLNSLINDQLTEENFLASVTNYNPNVYESKKSKRKTEPIRVRGTDKSEANVQLIYNGVENYYELSFDGTIELFYVGPEAQNMETTPLTYITLKNKKAIVYPNGALKDPLSIVMYGYLAAQGVYEMLPSDYVPKREAEQY